MLVCANYHLARLITRNSRSSFPLVSPLILYTSHSVLYDSLLRQQARNSLCIMGLQKIVRGTQGIGKPIRDPQASSELST